MNQTPHPVAASASEAYIWQWTRRSPEDPRLAPHYAFQVDDSLDVDRLELALRVLLARHYPNLRARFREVDGKLLKWYSPVPTRVLERVRLATAADRPPDWAQIDHHDGPLYRFTWTEHDGGGTLWIAASHLILDGNVYPVLCELLEALTRGDPQRVDCVRDAPRDSHAQFSSDSRVFWQQQVGGRALATPLPFNRAPRAVGADGTLFSRQALELSREDADLLLQSAVRHQVSPFQWVMACTTMVVGAYLSASGRNASPAMAHTVSVAGPNSALGCYINVVPCLIDYDPQQTGAYLLAQVKQWRRLARPHQSFPGVRIAAMSGPTEDTSLRPFNFLVNDTPGVLPFRTPRLQGKPSRLVTELAGISDADFTLSMGADKDRFRVLFECALSGADASCLSDFVAQWLKGLRWMASQPQRPLSEFSVAAAPMPVMSGGAVQMPARHPVIAVLAHARSQPDAVASCDSHRRLSYQEVAAIMQHVARWLREDAGEVWGPKNREGRRFAAPVALCLRRTAYLPAAMLGCLAAGTPFVPLASDMPVALADERIRSLECHAMICDDEDIETWRARHPRLRVCSPTGIEGGGVELDWRPSTPQGSISHAYWITTSGSSGQPKVVMVGQDNLFNLLESMLEKPGFHAWDRMLAIAPISFDISILELILPLLAGGSVEVVPDHVRGDGQALGQLIDRCRPSVVQATPSTWTMLQGAGWTAQRHLRIFVGGEALTAKCAAYLLDQGHDVYNVYGPTETTIWASAGRIIHADQCILGEPVRGTDFYVLNDRLESQPTGVPGELVIGGAAVAAGYLDGDNRGFIPASATRPAMYRTGDTVCYNGRGRLFFLGRGDTQVKLQGQRLDLTEVERALCDQAPQANWIAMICPDPAPHLVACYSVLGDWQPNPAQLFGVLEALSRRLPAYYVPQRLIGTDAIPRTAHGKLDRRALVQRVQLEQQLSPVASKAADAQVAKAGESVPDTATGGAPASGWPWLRSVIGECLDVWIDDPQLPFGWSGINSVQLNRLSYWLEHQYKLSLDAGEIISARSPLGLLAHLEGVRAGTTVGANDADHALRRPPAPVKSRSPLSQPDPRGEIAIIGVHAELPGANDLAQFWQQQLDGVCVIGPSDRYTLPRDFQAGFLKDIDHFDHALFRISPREAAQMDPRQRRLLHAVWRTIEHAGYAMSQLAGSRTGCYVGATGMDYQTRQIQAGASADSHWLQGSSAAMLANRLSHYFDWTGPSMTLDTACSSSFAALVRACSDLSHAQCDQAIVGASNLLLDRRICDALALGGFLSPDYRSAAFTHSANGYVRGEATVSVLLKRRVDAERDQDRVLGLIRACGENHGGRTASLTAPSAAAQTALLTRVYDRDLAGRIGYVESHGTGTLLGDMIECTALNNAWQSLLGPHASPVALGAVKRSVGHAEAASGLVSLVKVLLALEHQTIPRNAPVIGARPLEALEPRFYLPEDNVHWECDGPRMAGISNFGFGGHNAHIVVEQAPAVIPFDTAAAVSSDKSLFVVSAHSPAALMNARLALANRLADLPDDPAHRSAVAANLALGREHLRCRAAYCAVSFVELDRHLRAPSEAANTSPSFPDDGRPDSLMESLRRDFLAGEATDWLRIFPGGRGRVIDLPGAPFVAQSHWFDSRSTP